MARRLAVDVQHRAGLAHAPIGRIQVLAGRIGSESQKHHLRGAEDVLSFEASSDCGGGERSGTTIAKPWRQQNRADQILVAHGDMDARLRTPRGRLVAQRKSGGQVPAVNHVEAINRIR
jgi:hypothetical protein